MKKAENQTPLNTEVLATLLNERGMKRNNSSGTKLAVHSCASQCLGPRAKKIQAIFDALQKNKHVKRIRARQSLKQQKALEPKKQKQHI